MTQNGNGISRERLQRLAEVLPARHRVLIIPHDFPDPDALATAAALHLLLAKWFGKPSQIAYTGEVSRAENRELLRRFRFRWHELNDLRSPHRTVPCILVDTAPWARNVTIPPWARPIAVFDHHRHRVPARWRSLHLDIRPEAGATTTISYEYLKAAGIEIPRWLSAIMAYAIASETLDLSRDTNKIDLDAYMDLATHADQSVIGRIRHAPLPRVYFTRLREALTNARRWENLAWTHLKLTEYPEIIAEIADLLLRMEGMKWSFCTANMNGHLFVSLRSSARGARCSRILRSAIAGDGSAGGHHRMAAGFVDMKDLSEVDRENRRLAFTKALIRRILKKTSEQVDEIYPLGERLVEPKPNT
jgi:nanoRNase/pAp phosphatase (c-di-AMP/oligoRNAs hydrolase)